MRRRIHKPMIVVAVLAAVLTACGGTGDGAAEPEATTTPPATPAPTTKPPETGPPETGAAEDTTIDNIEWIFSDPDSLATVTLIDPGVEPRRVRIWAPVVGSTFTTTMTMDTAIDQTIDGTSITVANTIVVESTTEVIDVTDEGTVSLSEFGNTTVTAADATQQAVTQSAMDDMVGTSFYQLTSWDGTIIAMTGIDDLVGADLFTGGLGGATAPFPADPIGIGAVWETRGTIESSGLIFVQTTTVRVVDIVGNQLFVETTTDQVVDPDSPALIAMESLTVSTTGSGTATWDLDLGFPTTATADTSQILEAVIPVGDTTQTLFQTTDFSMLITTELR